MIPRITHSRSQLFSYVNDFEDGATVFGVSRDAYPSLFELAHPSIVQKAPNGWRPNAKGNCKYLWFPSGALTEDELESINDWREKYKHYVLLGLNQHIEEFFSNELDFCMALDFNYDPPAEKRTIYGEAEYQLKYQSSHPHFQVLANALAEAIPDLPVPTDYSDSYCFSCVPGSPTQASVQCRLAYAVAKKLGGDFINADLHCPKPALKGVPVAQKIPIWQEVYNKGCVQLSDSVEGRLVVVVDDLYQSGATLWMYAKYLKEQGATHVIGLPCVKSLRDSDNQ